MAQQQLSIEEFWQKEEEKWGEPFEQRGLIHILRSTCEGVDTGSWCLGMLTATRLIIQPGESHNWFSSMLNRDKEEDPDPVTLNRESLSAELISPKGRLSRLLSPVSRFHLRSDQEELYLEIDRKGEDLILPLLG